MNYRTPYYVAILSLYGHNKSPIIMKFIISIFKNIIFHPYPGVLGAPYTANPTPVTIHMLTTVTTEATISTVSITTVTPAEAITMVTPRPPGVLHRRRKLADLL